MSGLRVRKSRGCGPLNIKASTSRTQASQQKRESRQDCIRSRMHTDGYCETKTLPVFEGRSQTAAGVKTVLATRLQRG